MNACGLTNFQNKNCAVNCAARQHILVTFQYIPAQADTLFDIIRAVSAPLGDSRVGLKSRVQSIEDLCQQL